MCRLAPHWFSQSGAGLHSPHHEDRFPIVCVQFYSTYRFTLPMPSFVEDIFTASRPLGWQFKDTSSLSSAYMVSGKRPAFTLLFVLLCVVMCLFSPWLLQDVPLSLVFAVTGVCLVFCFCGRSEVWDLIPLSVLRDSYVCGLMAFIIVGQFPAIMSSNILPILSSFWIQLHLLSNWILSHSSWILCSDFVFHLFFSLCFSLYNFYWPIFKFAYSFLSLPSLPRSP